jgi:Cu-Zn family superoxide dismutase
LSKKAAKGRGPILKSGWTLPYPILKPVLRKRCRSLENNFYQVFKEAPVMIKYSSNIISAILVPAAVIFLMAAAQSISAGSGDTITKAVAVLHPTQGNGVSGTVTFTRVDNGVEVEADLMGLSSGKHGFHIHEFGDCSAPDGTSAGGHYNPTGQPHAGPGQSKRHMGDLGNIEADNSGKARYKRVDSHLVLNGPDSIIGRGVIVHGGADDLKSQPSGAAGPRVACGVIGVAQK